ncbi:hypothetical protein SAMN05444159_2763 [Bradyrhizobium lablabi]|uniref:Uncharacterized protein n=1 Tax=Bradyrhizobium lablabi TaxID=722472 RepID=A0A1M6QRA1_9BRAD|nr:hypothetical protein SAMN05444159_2763 [Bradyrhizobium lablabi]
MHAFKTNETGAGRQGGEKNFTPSCPGLSPGIHVFLVRASEDVDGRDKPTTVRFDFCRQGA